MKIAGFDIDNAAIFFREFEALSLEQQLEWQYRRKWFIAKFHYQNNNFYKSKIGDHLPNKWEELPIMNKGDYQIDIKRLLSNSYTLKNTYIANTSGSAGHPFFYAKNKEAHAITWGLAENRYGWHNITLDSKQARYYGSPLETTSKIKEVFKDWVMNRYRFLVFDATDDTFEKHLLIFNKNKFEYVYGYTNSLVLFARFLIKNQITLKEICPTITSCISTSETLTIEDRNLMRLGFGVDVVNEYGVSEAGGITAFEDVERNWRLSIETQFIEIVDDNGNIVNNGKEGKILITDLHNQAMPFLRYEIGDIGILNLNKNGLLTLRELTGRTNDTILLPSGRKSPGLTFYYVSRSILESSGVLKEFIIRQTKLDTFIFDIVSDRDLNTKELQQIKQKMKLYLESGLKLKINRISSIRRPKSGKLKHFYSEINDQ